MRYNSVSGTRRNMSMTQRMGPLQVVCLNVLKQYRLKALEIRGIAVTFLKVL